MKQQPKININLKESTPVTSSSGKHVFSEGVILRKVSRFLAGTDEDAIIPIPVFYDVTTGEVLIETLPKDLQQEYEDEQSSQ
jgi:hypothetical protein